MKMTIFILILIVISKASFAQCASDYTGNIGVSTCNNFDTAARLAEIKELTPTKIVIIHFAGIPYSMIQCNDTIVANLDCSSDSLTLIPITYTIISSGVHLSYTGHGRMYQGALKINFHNTNPNGQFDECVVYYKVTGIHDYNSGNNNIIISPNPAEKFVHIETKLDILSVEIIDPMGKTHACNLNRNNILDISNLTNGMYFLKMHAANNIILVEKIIKI